MGTPNVTPRSSGRALAALTTAGLAIIVAVALFVHVSHAISWIVLGVCVLVIIALGVRYRGGRGSH